MIKHKLTEPGRRSESYVARGGDYSNETHAVLKGTYIALCNKRITVVKSGGQGEPTCRNCKKLLMKIRSDSGKIGLPLSMHPSAGPAYHIQDSTGRKIAFLMDRQDAALLCQMVNATAPLSPNCSVT